jgi:hypothetical protein
MNLQAVLDSFVDHPGQWKFRQSAVDFRISPSDVAVASRKPDLPCILRLFVLGFVEGIGDEFLHRVPAIEPKHSAPLVYRHGVSEHFDARILASAREWMGATVFAGVALEALLLWALKHSDAASCGTDKGKRKKSLDEMLLTVLLDEAAKNGLISADSASQARLAKDARNLVHPGKIARSGDSCSKATALTALAGVYRVVDDLKQLSPPAISSAPST